MFEDKEITFTPINELGEIELIKKITGRFSELNDSHCKIGIGDDASVIKTFENQLLVISSDMMVEQVHFDCSYSPLMQIGYKSAITNFSDIYAMNAIPYGITVSIAISNRFSVEAIEEIYKGIYHACKEHDVKLLGGDTSSSLSSLCIAITVFGYEKEDQIVTRKNAKENDLICVTGNLGAAYAGLQILEREKSVFLENPETQPELSPYDYVVTRQLHPQAQRKMILFFKENQIIPTSMIDISDGLVNELYQICDSSGVGAIMYENKVPIDYSTLKVAEEFDVSPLTFALFGGEDYELLFTINQKDYDKIKDFHEISVLGHITDNKGNVQFVHNDHSVTQLSRTGWDHFNKKNP